MIPDVPTGAMHAVSDTRREHQREFSVRLGSVHGRGTLLDGRRRLGENPEEKAPG